MKRNYNSVIIGASNIGVGYTKPNDTKGIQTHAHAYMSDQRTTLIGITDIDHDKTKKFSKLWGVKGFRNVKEIFANGNIDVVSIASSDESHHSLLKEILKYKPKMVLCEKPITTDLKVSSKLVKLYQKEGILLAVNHTRRFNQPMINLANDIKTKKYGALINSVGIYTKGILHNGSHLIDLFRYFFGEVKRFRILSEIYDYKETDPTIDAFIEFVCGQKVHFVGANEKAYSVFDIDLFFEKGRIIISDFGKTINYYNAQKRTDLKGEKKLFHSKSIDTDLSSSINKVVSNLIDAYEKNDKLYCSGYDAVETQRICCVLIKESKNRWSD